MIQHLQREKDLSPPAPTLFKCALLNWRRLDAVASDKKAVQRPHPLDQQQPVEEARAVQPGLAGQMRSGVMTGKRAGEGMPARLDQRGGKRRNRQRKPEGGPG